jgi:hypothetical protein
MESPVSCVPITIFLKHPRRLWRQQNIAHRLNPLQTETLRHPHLCRPCKSVERGSCFASAIRIGTLDWALAFGSAGQPPAAKTNDNANDEIAIRFMVRPFLFLAVTQSNGGVEVLLGLSS